MKNQVKVSVIMPSLNVAGYISQCLDSVLAQTLIEIELICVDAGSVDGTLAIVEEYAKKDKRIRLIHAAKKSYGYQMNLGILAAHGEYLGIVETDDYISENMYEELYAAANAREADLVKSDFHRFIGSGADGQKALCRAVPDPRFYHCLVDISEHQDVFYGAMNTWCGIYKREFVLSHQILHNETPGASYQDNGFWFQTYMYAKRAYFVDQAYYWNRRDNPQSSVYDNTKVYCICDEFAFILKILKQNEGLFERFKYTYGHVCFQNYRRALERIDSSERRRFIRRFADDFRRLEELGMLDSGSFERADWKHLKSVLKDPEGSCEQSVSRKNAFFDRLPPKCRLIIYGAGMAGQSVLGELIERRLESQVLCFAVSRECDNYQEYRGIPIRQIEGLLPIEEDVRVIVAVTPRYEQEILELLSRSGVHQVMSYAEYV